MSLSNHSSMPTLLQGLIEQLLSRRRATNGLGRLTRIARRLKIRALPVPARIRELLGPDRIPAHWRTPA